MSPLRNVLHHDTLPDLTIFGAGIIGLSLALELNARGARVRVIERGDALGQASVAAAGMLAAHDPHNPPALLPLAELSLTLYPEFLARIAALSGVAVRYQTETTMQYGADQASVHLAEHSIDPRQLAHAIRAAVHATSIDLQEYSGLSHKEEASSGHVIYASGAWTTWPGHTPMVVPRKGQMLRVALPPSLHGLQTVHRNAQIYVVPRTHGLQAGTALIGATVEDAGFDTTTNARALHTLRELAVGLLPALADQSQSPQLEAWAGLRPATVDQLPIVGTLDGKHGDVGSSHYFATGHLRNGILLAPATAVLLADLLEGKPARLDLRPFSPQRFAKVNRE